MTDSSVDFPLPEGPMNNVSSRRCSSNETPRSASVFESPAPNVWRNLRAFKIAFGGEAKSKGRTEAEWRAPFRAGAKRKPSQLIQLLMEHVLAVRHRVETGEIESAVGRRDGKSTSSGRRGKFPVL